MTKAENYYEHERAYAVVVDWCMKYWTMLRLCGVDVESGHSGPCCPCDNSGTPPEVIVGAHTVGGGQLGKTPYHVITSQTVHRADSSGAVCTCECTQRASPGWGRGEQ